LIHKHRTVENEGGFEIGAISGESPCLAASPAETTDGELAVAGWQLDDIIGRSVDIAGDLVGLELSQSAGSIVIALEIFGAAAIGTKARKHVGRDGDIARFGKLIGHAADPIRQSFVLVNYYDGRRFVFHLRVDEEALHFAVAVFDLGPFMMPRR